MSELAVIMRKEEEAHCGIPNTCERIVPNWLVLLDNVPTVSMFIIGAVLVWLIWWPLSVLFLAYCASSIVLFWALICPHCHHYGSRACPCGYGVMAPRFFESRLGKSDRSFREVFRKNIAIMFPCWIVPFVAGAYLMATAFTMLVLVLFVLFCVVGFALIPAISRFVGCKDCEIKDDCPWITSKKNERV
jgi:hypothetical protein